MKGVNRSETENLLSSDKPIMKWWDEAVPQKTIPQPDADMHNTQSHKITLMKIRQNKIKVLDILVHAPVSSSNTSKETPD